MTVSAQFIVDKLVCILGLCALQGYVVLWERLCFITRAIWVGDPIDAVGVEVMVAFFVLLDRTVSAIGKEGRDKITLDSRMSRSGLMCCGTRDER